MTSESHAITNVETAKAWSTCWPAFRDGRRLGILRAAIRGQRTAASILRHHAPAAAADHDAAADYLAALLPAQQDQETNS